ncbi:unnamed protein product [Spirodela intermedia]|uniref:HMA domain-containing protein n=1 Tax=Spirodela intermedia TaxID=51605 RepID=A0A7I8I9S1_SPIIN|nr:unnamed protein product [Spirodela intermedia]CAA6654268.1 unnamed protein product [Spirodela intermedia]
MDSGGEKVARAGGPDQLKYQTWVLKVSIHCEGCKRKVKKALQSIEGVYTTAVDAPQQKVIVTGNVDAEVLVKKLLRAGKHAEIWPQSLPPAKEGGGYGGGKGNKCSQGNGKSREKDPVSSNDCEKRSPEEGGASDGDPESPAAAEAEATKSPTKNEEASNIENRVSSPSPEKASANSGGGEKGSGGGGRRKGKKDRKEDAVDSAACQSHHQQVFSHFPPYPALPSPLYAVSYSAVHPNAGNGAAFYASLPHSFVLGPDPHYYLAGPCYSPPPPAALVIPPSDEASYHAFSEENANACHVM